MALLHLPLSLISEKELQALIDGKVAESRTIEYKRDTYGQADADHAEWLADLSSFANTAGGDLIIGIEAKSGVPIGLAPLTDALDATILKLEQIAQSNLQPRVPGLIFKSVAIAGGGYVLVIRIPRSYNPPHRIVRQGKGQNRFWARSAAGKYEPNVDELRTLFMLAPQIAERIRDWRFNRIAAIAADDTPAQLLDRTRLILHLVPFSSFDPGALIPLSGSAESSSLWGPIGSTRPQNWRINFDGLLLTSNADQQATSQRAYTQVYRSGRVEAVASSIAAGSMDTGAALLTSVRIEGLTLTTLTRYLKVLQTLRVDPPFALMVSLVGTKGGFINTGAPVVWYEDDVATALDRDQYHFAEVILDGIPSSIQECAAMVRPFIEQLANTAGRAASASFGENGEYLHHFS